MYGDSEYKASVGTSEVTKSSIAGSSTVVEVQLTNCGARAGYMVVKSVIALVMRNWRSEEEKNGLRV